MEVNESHSRVFNRPFVRITDGAEETGDYLFVEIEVRQAIALRDALLAKYPVERWDPVIPVHSNIPVASEPSVMKNGTYQLTIDGDRLVLSKSDVDGDTQQRLSVALPPNIRLCRLVEGA